jgi:hypothetical protein
VIDGAGRRYAYLGILCQSGDRRLNEARGGPPRMDYRLRVGASQEMVPQGSDLLGEDVPAREVPVLAVAGEDIVGPAGDDRPEREVR